VATAVPESGQGIVLGEDPDPWTRAWSAEASAAADCPDRGSQASGRMLDLEPVATQDLGNPGRGLDLFEGRLRVRMNSMRQTQDLVARVLHRSCERRLRLRERLGWTGGGQ
jgi:hypothetical protein